MATTKKINEIFNACVTFAEVAELATKMSRNIMGNAFLVKSDVRLKAPKTTAKTFFAEQGYDMPVFVKITLVANARSYSYENNVNKQLEKKGNDADFSSSEMSGYEWVVYPILKKAIKDGSMYLTLTYKNTDKTMFQTAYVAVTDNGVRLTTPNEQDFIKQHLVTSSGSKKQSEAGLSQDEQINVRNYKCENIIAVGTAKNLAVMFANFQYVTL